MSLKVVISGGGTGGHVFPAIAIAKQINFELPDAEILFVGAKGKIEMQKVPESGYKIIGLEVVGLQRKLTVKNILKNLIFPFKLLKSLNRARQIIQDFNPDIAIGVGGYASGPTLRVAGKMNIPTLLQEQNSYAGLTNKLLAKKASSICVAYDGMDKFFDKKKIIFTGNPIRKDILNNNQNRNEAISHFNLDINKKTILVIGGSLGARTINLAIKDKLELLNKNNVQVLWQTGKYYFDDMASVVKTKEYKNIHPKAFIKRMDLAYGVADIIISRAGALSVSELCVVKKPAILVPSPNVAEDHQTSNAISLVNKKAAVHVKDIDADTTLVEKVLNLLNDEYKCAELIENISALARPDATEKIVNEIFKIVKLKN